MLTEVGGERGVGPCFQVLCFVARHPHAALSMAGKASRGVSMCTCLRASAEEYILPGDVETAIQRVRDVATRYARMLPPPVLKKEGGAQGAVGEEGGGKFRIPQEVLSEIKALLPPLYERWVAGLEGGT